MTTRKQANRTKPASQGTVQQRKKFYSLLHLGKQYFGWDDEFYYDIWLPARGATKKNGKYSASTLSIRQLIDAVDELKRMGFKVKSANGNKKAVAV